MIEIETTEKSGRTFDKPIYLTFDYGQHLVRLLGSFRKVYTHYIRSARAVVECPGEDCPICMNNKKLYADNKNNSNPPGLIPRSLRHYINVLDRTEVKVCPECQAEVKRDSVNKFPAVCPDGHLIVDAQILPSNKVKLANISDTNAQLLKGFQLSILDANGEPVGLENYDILFMVTKSGDKKNITPMPVKDNNDAVSVPDDALYNLDSAVLKLSTDEIIELLKGVSLRDIFVARRGDEEVEVSEKAMEVSAEIEQKLKELGF